jgi:hypothetical protein
MFNLLFPREIANPKRYNCRTQKEFYNFINKNINSTNLYTNVYNFKNFTEYGYPIYESAIIDRIYFDCDQRYKENGEWFNCPAYENMLKIHEWCKKNNIKHLPRCTGSGYDVIILVDTNYKIMNKKACVANAQSWLCKELDIQMDKQVVGDIARIHRIDNTYNFKTKAQRFCIPLSLDIIYTGEQNIFNYSKNQNFKSNLYGEKLWDISAFDVPEFVYKDELKIDDVKINEIDFSNLSGNIPDCVKKLLLKKEPNWEQRRSIIIALRDNQYLFDEAVNILKNYLTKKKFIHCFKEERQIQYLYANEKYLFPKQEELISQGVCTFQKGQYCDKAKYGCKLYGR